MSSSTIGGINVTISATIDKFVKPLATARQKAKQFSGEMSGLTKAVAGFGAALSALGVVATLKKTLDAVDEIGKSADRLGVSAQTVRVLQLTADETGVSFSAMANAVQKAGISIESALGGDKAKVSAFKQLSLDIKELKQLSPETQLAAIAQAFEKIKSASERSSLAQAIFGKAGTQLTGLLGKGGTEIKVSQDRINTFGGTLSANMVDKIQKANDTVENLGMAFQKLVTEVTVSLTPAITNLAHKMVWWADRFSDDGTSRYKDTKLRKFARDATTAFLPNVNSAANEAAMRKRAEESYARYSASHPEPVASGLRMQYERKKEIDALDKWSADRRKAQAISPASLLARAGAAIASTNIGRTVGDLGGGLLDKAKQGAAQANWLRLYGPTMLSIWRANNRPESAPATGMAYRGVAAQDPLSREGFAQRVRSLGQGDNVANKQLKAQERTANAVERMAKNPPVTLKAANI